MLAAVLLAGCEKEAAPGLGNLPTSNPQVSVDVLFERDGCAVYRFYDNGYAHYFARCNGRPTNTISSGHSESCGKGCTRWVPEIIIAEQR